jgi:hypothetical protein
MSCLVKQATSNVETSHCRCRKDPIEQGLFEGANDNGPATTTNGTPNVTPVQRALGQQINRTSLHVNVHMQVFVQSPKLARTRGIGGTCRPRTFSSYRLTSLGMDTTFQGTEDGIFESIFFPPLHNLHVIKFASTFLACRQSGESPRHRHAPLSQPRPCMDE